MSDAWVFGYGSLVWRPAFAFAEARDGWITGWRRRLWQGSTDHRGVPGAPGRVVTLVRDEDARTWGRSFRLPGDQAGAILADLDVREQGGYERIRTSFADASEVDRPDLEVILWVAGPANPDWLGPASVSAMARQVSAAAGPSGSNVEYVLRLAQALRDGGASDPELFEVEAMLRA